MWQLSDNLTFFPSLSSPGIKSEVADFSSTDYEFSRLPKMLFVTVGATGGVLIMRLPGDDVDVVLAITSNSYHPWAPTHIRMTSTVASVIGMMT